jgi:hypothetical protein
MQVYDAADRLKAWAPQKRRQLEKWLNVEVRVCAYWSRI